MSVAFNSASAAQTLSFPGGTSLSWSHTASGSDRAVYVGVIWAGFPNTVDTTASVTYNGVSMTSVGKSSASGGSLSPYVLNVQVFELKNPPTGANTVVVTFSGTSVAVAGSSSYTGVNQSTAHGTAVTANGDSADLTASVSSTSSDNLVVGLLGTQYSTNSLTAGQTQRWSGANSSNWRGLFEDTAATGGSVTVSGTMSPAGKWAEVAFEILAPPPVPTNSVAPSCAPSSGTVADTFTFAPGSWTGSPTSYETSVSVDGGAYSVIDTSAGGNPSKTGTQLGGPGTIATRVRAQNAGGWSGYVAGTTLTVTSASGGVTPSGNHGLRSSLSGLQSKLSGL